MSLAALDLDGSNPDKLLLALENSLLSRRAEAENQVKKGGIMTMGATVLALAIPLMTWFVSFSASNASKENNLAVFAFSSVPLAGIFVLITITMLRRRRSLEDQIERVDDRLLDLRKLRVIARTKSVEEINVFREIVLARALAGQASLLGLGKEEDEAQASLNVYGSLVKIVNDARPKK